MCICQIATCILKKHITYTSSMFSPSGNCGKNETTCEEESDCCDLVPPEHRENCGCNDTATPCTPTDPSREWCQHIYDPIFHECHAVIDPAPYFRDCLYDECYTNDTDTSCWAFEAYATRCANKGICLKWRRDNFCRKFQEISVYLRLSLLMVNRH